MKGLIDENISDKERQKLSSSMDECSELISRLIKNEDSRGIRK